MSSRYGGWSTEHTILTSSHGDSPVEGETQIESVHATAGKLNRVASHPTIQTVHPDPETGVNTEPSNHTDTQLAITAKANPSQHGPRGKRPRGHEDSGIRTDSTWVAPRFKNKYYTPIAKSLKLCRAQKGRTTDHSHISMHIAYASTPALYNSQPAISHSLHGVMDRTDQSGLLAYFVHITQKSTSPPEQGLNAVLKAQSPWLSTRLES